MKSALQILEQKGFQLHLNSISKLQEQMILKNLSQQEWSDDLKRKTIQYGYKYNYSTKKTQKANKDIPIWLQPYTEKYDQVIINSYEKGQGISKHTDHKSYFNNQIEIISMMSDCYFVFARGKEEHKILVPARSRMVLKDEIRYEWTHEIKRVAGKRMSITMRKMVV